MRIVIALIIGLLAGPAFADEPRKYVLGEVENVKKLGVCFDETASQQVVEAAKKIGTGYVKFIEYLTTMECGTASGSVVFNRILDTYHDEDSSAEDRTMSRVETWVLKANRNHLTVWAFVGAELIEPRQCDDCF